MKTPEDIKKGLASCSADECHGNHADCPYIGDIMCIRNICGDAFAYIEQLERERDALLIEVEGDCEMCKHNGSCVDEGYCAFCENSGSDKSPCCNCVYSCNWEWRGVKEDDK